MKMVAVNRREGREQRKTWPLRRTLGVFFILWSFVFHTGCSLRQLAVGALADSLAHSGDVFASDDDPQLVREAMPFALKTLETLLAESPRHPGLLLAACRGFTQYGYGFVVLDAERLEQESYRLAEEARQRALKLTLRGRDYCFDALELAFPDARRALIRAEDDALDRARREDVELLYWTAASWGAAISLGLDRPELVVDLPAVRLLIERALELDPEYDRGALHETMISIEGVPETMGGSVEQARYHYERALALNGGTRAGTYVTWATTVSVARQDREEFERLLRAALDVDPDAEPAERLANLIAQERARLLLARIDELFI